MEVFNSSIGSIYIGPQLVFAQDICGSVARLPLVGVVAMTSHDSSLQSLSSRPLPHLNIDAARSLCEDLTLQIQRDNAVKQDLVDELLSLDDERFDLKRRRDALTFQMGKIEEDINHLERVILSREEERNELYRNLNDANLNDAMDESSDKVAESAAGDDTAYALT